MNRLNFALRLVVLSLPLSVLAEDKFVGPLPATAAVDARLNNVYRKAGDTSLSFDLYLPSARPDPVPVVIFVNGIGADWMRGHPQYTGWGRAVTARGLAGITMDSREATVDDDVRALIAHLTANAGSLGLDASRITLWSCSANVARGLPLAQSFGPPVRSAVVYYGTADVASFRRDLPVLFVRAGLDGTSLNQRLEALVARAFADNAPVESLNVASGVHGFDIRDDTEVSRAAIARTLDFLATTLGAPFSQSIRDGSTLASAGAATYRSDWPAAAAAYDLLTRARPDDSLLWQRLGESRRSAGDQAGALTALEKALSLGSPNHGIVSFAIATLRAQQNNVEKAFVALQGMKPQLRFFAQRLRTEAVFEPLRKDPRFEDLLKGVPPPPK